MDGREQNHFVDELLDASLARSRSEEPRPGFEARLLASARTRQHATEHRRWAWPFAVSAIALAMIAFVMANRQSSRSSSPRTAESVALPRIARGVAPPVVVNPKELRAPRKSPRPNSRANTPELRPPEFPTPAPPTAQEKLLLRYVGRMPTPILIALQTSSAASEALRIMDIRIDRLETQAIETLND